MGGGGHTESHSCFPPKQCTQSVQLQLGDRAKPYCVCVGVCCFGAIGTCARRQVQGFAMCTPTNHRTKVVVLAHCFPTLGLERWKGISQDGYFNRRAAFRPSHTVVSLAFLRVTTLLRAWRQARRAMCEIKGRTLVNVNCQGCRFDHNQNFENGTACSRYDTSIKKASIKLEEQKLDGSLWYTFFSKS